jgi:hypothetical protein
MSYKEKAGSKENSNHRLMQTDLMPTHIPSASSASLREKRGLLYCCLVRITPNAQ